MNDEPNLLTKENLPRLYIKADTIGKNKRFIRLTANKLYKVINIYDDNGLVIIKDDYDDQLFAYIPSCAHLSFNKWTVVLLDD